LHQIGAAHRSELLVKKCFLHDVLRPIRAARRIGNSNGLLAPRRRRRPPQHPPPAAPLCARLLRAAQRAATASPERPGARRCVALADAGQAPQDGGGERAGMPWS